MRKPRCCCRHITSIQSICDSSFTVWKRVHTIRSITGGVCTFAAGAMICLAFIHNLLRRHPATTQMLHRPPAQPKEGAATAEAAADAEVPATPAPAAGESAAVDAAAPRGSAIRIAGQPTRIGDGPTPELPSGRSEGTAVPSGANGLADGTCGSSIDASSDGEDKAAAGQPAAAAAAAQQQGQQEAAASAAAHPGVDVFDEGEPDPGRCRALESSLWEVAALRSHYDPQVICSMSDFLLAMVGCALAERASAAEGLHCFLVASLPCFHGGAGQGPDKAQAHCQSGNCPAA